jgi:hypothetical protein
MPGLDVNAPYTQIMVRLDRRQHEIMENIEMCCLGRSEGRVNINRMDALFNHPATDSKGECEIITPVEMFTLTRTGTSSIRRLPPGGD